MKKLFVILTLVLAVFIVSIPNVPAQPVGDTISVCVHPGGGMYLLDPIYCVYPNHVLQWNVGIDPTKIYDVECSNVAFCSCNDPVHDRIITGGAECPIGWFLVASRLVIPAVGSGKQIAWFAVCDDASGVEKNPVSIVLYCAPQ